jgi:hypothetical protein
VISPVSVARQPNIDRAELARNAHERAVFVFATVQFAALIYLQKFALFATAFPLAMDMLIMFAGVGWMVLSGNLSFVPSRLAVFLVFLTFCFASEMLAGGSLPSVTQLVLLYVPMTLCANLSEDGYRRMVDRFIMLMVLPAGIMVMQYAYQKLTGLADPIDMQRFVPKSMLMPGFFYNAHYPWNSTFSRPNGFFFLEPSGASVATATAAILEITYFRRRWCVLLMILATFLSLAATGILMLMIAAPFLLYHENNRVAALVVIATLAVVIVAYMLDLPLPVISRADELSEVHSSGGQRLLLPAEEFWILLSDPSYIVTGAGAGSSLPSYGVIWPPVKLLREYGLLAMSSFLVLYIMGVAKYPGLALKIALSIIYFFGGGNLLTPPTVNLVILLLFVLPPDRRRRSLPRFATTLDAAGHTWRRPGWQSSGNSKPTARSQSIVRARGGPS